ARGRHPGGDQLPGAGTGRAGRGRHGHAVDRAGPHPAAGGPAGPDAASGAERMVRAGRDPHDHATRDRLTLSVRVRPARSRSATANATMRATAKKRRRTMRPIQRSERPIEEPSAATSDSGTAIAKASSATNQNPRTDRRRTASAAKGSSHSDIVVDEPGARRTEAPSIAVSASTI